MENTHLNRLAIAKYRFRFVAKNKIVMPVYKGSTFHGGFGHALKTISPTYYRILFEPGRSGDHPKPFVLLPPLDNLLVYEPGDKFDCELTLFGSAVQHFSICHAAMEFLGNQFGIGENRGRFKVEGVDAAIPVTRPDDSSEYNASQPGAATGDIIAASRILKHTDCITLNFSTRLRLKENDQLLRNPPSFRVFINRLLGRLDSLGNFYGDGWIIGRETREKLSRLAGEVEISVDSLTWEKWNRFSGRQKTTMNFDGFLGPVTYKGDCAPFIPYLAAGEWTHVGGKTSFGLGKYVMEAVT